MKAKEEEEARKFDLRAKEKRQRELRAAEDAKLKELRLRAQEDAAAAMQQLALRERAAEEKRNWQKKMAEERESKKQAARRERQRLQKEANCRAVKERKSEEQRREAERKLKEREAKGTSSAADFDVSVPAHACSHSVVLRCSIEKEREARAQLKRLVDAQADEVKRKKDAQRIKSKMEAVRQQQVRGRRFRRDNATYLLHPSRFKPVVFFCRTSWRNTASCCRSKPSRKS